MKSWRVTPLTAGKLAGRRAQMLDELRRYGFAPVSSQPINGCKR